jgi:hypothetical protein
MRRDIPRRIHKRSSVKRRRAQLAEGPMAQIPTLLTVPKSGAVGANPERTIRHFNQIDLSRRWNVSPRTLERWRWLKQGPEYLKIGGHVVYRLEDIERYEAGQIKNLGVAIIPIAASPTKPSEGAR